MIQPTPDNPVLVFQHAHAEVLDHFQAQGAYGREGWLSIGAVENFVFHASRLNGNWGVVWGLLDTEYLVLDEPLRSMVDSGKYIDLFRAIWEVRFQLSEGADVRRLVDDIAQWLNTGDPCPQLGLGQLTQQQQLDNLLFLLTLAAQNELVRPAMFVYARIDRAAEQEDKVFKKRLLNGLLTLIKLIERWAPLGSPASLLLSLSDTHKLDSRLRAKIESLLVPPEV